MASTILVPIEEQQKKWFRLWKSIISKCQECINTDEIHLLQVLSNNEGTCTWQNLKHLTECALNNSQNTYAIFKRISNKIKTNKDDQNEIIQEMLAEIKAIPCLLMFGFKNLIYQRSNSLDFNGTINNINKNIEVTYIRGPNFKTQTINAKLSNLGTVPVYDLKSTKLINKLKKVYQDKEEQFARHRDKNESILFIVTNLLEADQFWLENQQYENKHPIQAFVDSCSISTIVLAPGLIPYISHKLKDILLSFDRNKYIEFAYGIDANEEEKKQKEIQKKLEEKFWEGYKESAQEQI